MTIMLGKQTLEGTIKMADAIELLEKSLRHEAKGATFVSSKFVNNFKGGSMRILFAVDYEAGYFATKAYHVIENAGVRYLISLYRLQDGFLLALLDGQLITGLRTGAASGVMARKISIPDPISIGVIGSGYQSRSQLESLATVYKVSSANVFSPTASHREDFANSMSERLGFTIKPKTSIEAAVAGCNVVVSASSARSKEPILSYEWVKNCRLLCAVGNTRPQFAEIDLKSIQASELLVVDSIHAIEEAGELRNAKKQGALPESKVKTLSGVAANKSAIPADGLIIFKSVGTALQDLALAVRYYELLGKNENFPNSDDLASLKMPSWS